MLLRVPAFVRATAPRPSAPGTPLLRATSARPQARCLGPVQPPRRRCDQKSVCDRLRVQAQYRLQHQRRVQFVVERRVRAGEQQAACPAAATPAALRCSRPRCWARAQPSRVPCRAGRSRSRSSPEVFARVGKRSVPHLAFATCDAHRSFVAKGWMGAAANRLPLQHRCMGPSPIDIGEARNGRRWVAGLFRPSAACSRPAVRAASSSASCRWHPAGSHRRRPRRQASTTWRSCPQRTRSIRRA